MEEKIRLAVFGQKRLSREGGIAQRLIMIMNMQLESK